MRSTCRPSFASFVLALVVAGCDSGSSSTPSGKERSDGGDKTSAGGVGGGTSSSTGGANATNGDAESGGMVVAPGDPGAHDVLFTIDTTANRHAISPYIYGTN